MYQVRNFHKALSALLATLLVASTTPLAALAMPAIPHHAEVAIPAPVAVNVKTGPRRVELVKTSLVLSATPSDLEITTARVFQEPLIPMSGSEQDGENSALASAIKSFKAKSDTEDLSAFEQFLAKYPKSRWTPSLQVSLGQIKFQSGFLSDALELWSSAWEQSKDESDKQKSLVASSAIANLMLLNSRLGRQDELKKYLAEVKGRAFFGSDEQKLVSAKEGLWSMEHKPECSFKCGPFAVNNLLNAVNKTHLMNPILEKAESTKSGTSLLQVKEWADKVGLKYQIAKRTAAATLIVPSVMHWKLDHFAALTEVNNNRYHLKDPTFDTDGQCWITAKAIDQESDGYFLVPVTTSLPQGWQSVSDDEAKTIFGKGIASGRNGNNSNCPAPQSNPCSCDDSCDNCDGMAKASVWSMLATLHIADKPLGYEPPVGPAIGFKFDYNHLQTNQPTTFTFTNVGQNWNFNWLSYLTVDSGTNVATVRLRSGGSEVYTPSGGVYSPDFLTQALLVNMGGGVYQRQMKDGSIETYSQSDGSSPARIFLTQVQDAQGNSVFIQYDANFRLTTITDSIGQVSTLTYVSNTVGNAGFYKIASIADPFARTCSFTYDSTVTNLLSITDVINLKSSFQYDTTSGFISQMSTPYGTTGFYQYVPGVDVYPARGIRFTFPDGSSSVLENWLNEPKSTYFWDRHAIAMYPNDPVNKVYTHCELTMFTIDINTNLEASSIQKVVHPLEWSSPTFFTYPSNLIPNYAGFNNLVASSTKDLGNIVVNATVGGTPQAGDTVTILIDGVYAGYIVQAGDTLEKIASEIAKSVNSSVDYQTRGISAGAAGRVISLRSEQVGMTHYGKYISPGSTETLTFNSQARQTTIATLTGTITPGDVVTIHIDNPGRVSINYTVQPGDTATTICTGMAALINANATWQSYNGVATPTAGTILLTSFSPEAADYATGTTGTESFAYSSKRNGSIQLAENQYNSTGNMTQTIDPIGRKFSYSYAANGIDLLEKRETQGTDNYLLGHWEYNAKHEPIVFIDGSAQRTEYTYNSSGQPLTVKDANNNTTTMTYTGTCKATVGGTITAGNIATITVFDAGLAGGQKAVNYTVLGTDTTTTIATALKNAINADTAFAAIGLTATSAAAVVTMSSNSVNVTTYTKTTTGTVTLALGANTWGYLTKIDGPLTGSQDVTTLTYDSFGRLATQTSSTGYQIAFTYDAMNRPLRTTYPDTTFEQTVYDKLDAVLTRDRNARWTERSYNSLDQLAYEVDPLGRKTQYTWCLCGSLAVLTDPLGRNTSWSHDIEGRLTTKTYPDNSTYTYLYEQKTSNVKTRTDALSQKTNYFYNPDGTLYQTSYPNPINPTAPVTNYWDYNFRRLTKTTKNDWGSYSYTYNNYVTSSGATPITGGGMLQLVHNDVIANSDISYLYDSLGRTTNRSINGASNSITWTYDAMSRVTAESNALGNFTYSYVDNTAGSSKGVTRLASVTYPNSQVTKYDWYPTAQDERLRQISNLGPSGATISQFSYRYDPAGQIKQWQQLQGNTSLNYALDYDQAGQLTTAAASGGPQTSAYLKQNYYAYDPASNRTGNQSSTVTRARFTGTVTTGNVLTITVNDSGLTGGSKAINYTVQAGDTLTTIATKMAEAITVDTSLQALTVSASSSGAIIGIKSTSPNVTSFAASTSGGATTAIAMGVTDNFVESASIGGTKKTGDILTITVKDPALAGGSKNVNYTVLAADTLTTIATAIKNAINADASLTAIGVSSTSVGTNITIKSTSANATTYAQSVNAGSTETITLSVNQNGPMVAGISGTKTTGDTVTIVTYDSALSGGTRSVTYTVLAGDTLATITSGIATALNADANLQGIGVSASASGQRLTITSNSINPTTYRVTTSATATEVVSLGLPPNGVQTAVIGGTKTTGDVLTITTFDPALAGGSKAVSYTVLAGDTLTSITTNMASAINADTALQAIAVTATSSGTVLNIKSASANATTYTKSTSGGATETIALAPSTSVTQYGYNNLNEMTSIAAGGATKWQGATNKALNSATVNSNAVTLNSTQSFAGNATLANGVNSIAVSGTDGASSTSTNSYQISANGSVSANATFDANGNILSDGVAVYLWDAENRLIKVTYSAGDYSQFAYEAQGSIGRVVETAANTIVDTKILVRAEGKICEERDINSVTVKKFSNYGQDTTSSKYFYSRDNLGSISELTDNSGSRVSQYSYGMFGEVFQVLPGPQADFQYAGTYFHTRSKLNLATYRVYNANIARWLSRDPVGENAGTNLYCYANNRPTVVIDPHGLADIDPTQINCVGYACRAGGSAQPSPGQSARDFLKDLGYKCKKVSSSAECKCSCKEFKVMFYIYSYVNNPSGADPWSDPWIFAAGNDSHALREDSTGSWSYVPYKMGNPGYSMSGLGDADDYWKGNVPKLAYCCCKPKRRR
ncbi:MAG: LysM peptidoglycan-binding domain-containing protein [Candidatus Obscuribacter sp.]|jgi:RHS repeat-associated protein|nr:LysM peptidoglycan-binding domain-containing protein [Candidatus Obscuribacter sp.]